MTSAAGEPLGQLRIDRSTGKAVQRSSRRITCPACAYQWDSLADADFGDAGEPADGDYSICFCCGEVSVFAVGVFGTVLRAATIEELAEFSSSRWAGRVRDLHQYHAERRPR